MRVTVHDVAREAGVSTATVSRALRGVGSVSPALTSKVRSTAERLGYIPNRVGQALRSQQANAWAIITPELNAFVAQVVSAVETMATAGDTSVYLGITNYDAALGRRYVEAALSQHISGLLIGGLSGVDELLRDVPLPVVLVDRAAEGTAWDSVVLDNHGAGVLAAEHLVARGCTRLGCITGPEEDAPVGLRADGFASALGVGAASVVRRTELTIQGSKEATAALLAEHPELDALYCTSGPLSLGAYFALQEAGAHRVAFVATDDEEWTAMAVPSVTVVQQPVAAIGETAASLLRARIEQPDRPVQRVVLEPTLIVRDSTPAR